MDEIPRPLFKRVKEQNCVRHIRYSTSKETVVEEDDSIKVFARLKPLNDGEEQFLEWTSDKITYIDKDKRGIEKVMGFSFHHVLNDKTSQQQVFEKTMNTNVSLFLKGEDQLLFAYGTTSSGKTYTIIGNSENPGILPRCSMKLYSILQGSDSLIETDLCPDQGFDIRRLSFTEMERVKTHKDCIMEIIESCENISSEDCDYGFDADNMYQLLKTLNNEIECTEGIDFGYEYAIWVSYLEVYNENIYDLLDVNLKRNPLKIGLDSKRNNYVKGLNHIQVPSWVSFWKVFLYGQSRLHTNETKLNKASSRSHSVFTIKLLKMKDNRCSVSSLSLCDLAGTERQKKALTSGDSLRESKNINTSLLVLNRCFSAVRENKINNQKIKPPYRESKLTQIFQKAFSYCEQITMFVNISQSLQLAEETKNVLKMSAVAQEMMLPLPKIQRFVKPTSRFSMACMNQELPIINFIGISESSVTQLSSTFSSKSNSHDETIKSLEGRIQELEEDVSKKDLQIKKLIEISEDARIEFLNLEKTLEETRNQLEDEKYALSCCMDNNTDLTESIEIKDAQLKKYEATLAEKNAEIKSLVEKIDLMEEQNKIKKKRPLLREVVCLEESFNISNCINDVASSTVQKFNSDPGDENRPLTRSARKGVHK